MGPIKFRQYVGIRGMPFHYFGWVDNTWVSPVRHYFDKWPMEQFTGLEDKNGKEIYKGDKLSFEDDIYRVFFNRPGAFFVARFTHSETLEPRLWRFAEVVSNIHEKD